MKSLFEKTRIGSLSLTNRFVYSATWDGNADDKGCCTSRNIDSVVERVRGGVGLVITGMACVSPEGKAAPWQLAIYHDEFIPALSKLSRAVHDAQGKIVLQLAHGGAYSASALTGRDVLGPSANDSQLFPPCREISTAEIKQVVQSFGAAAGRAKKAGFDGVQLHSAHGYLLSQFLSPFFNKRTDNYGGSLENRARILLETFRAVRKEVGEEYPVFVKINSEDFVEGGLTADEMLQVCAMLEKEGVDAVEMSGGTIYASGAYSSCRVGQNQDVYYKEAAVRYKNTIGVPLLLVGGVHSIEVADKIVHDGTADYISICRPLIREPGLIERWNSGDMKPAGCKYCNGCFGPGLKGEGVRCVVA